MWPNLNTISTLCVNRFTFPPRLAVVTQAVFYFCMFRLHHCYLRTNESVAPHGKLQKILLLQWRRGLQRKVEHSLYPSSTLSPPFRLLSGPGSPKTRAFTLHCACYSSQHSTHGHVSVLIAPNGNFHSHHAQPACFFFLHISVPLAETNSHFYCLNKSCSSSLIYLFLVVKLLRENSQFLHPGLNNDVLHLNANMHKCYKILEGRFPAVCIKSSCMNSTVGLKKKKRSASFLGSWGRGRKKHHAARMPGFRALRPGCVTLLIKIRVAFCCPWV